MSRNEAPVKSEPDARSAEPQVGNDIQAENSRWSFGGDVPQTFEQHIERSVPQYREGHEMVAAFSDFFLYDGAVAIELGCANGALTRRIAEWNDGKKISVVGIDREPAMVEAARENCAALSNIEIREDDIIAAALEASDLIVSYYTMQFVRPAVRQMLLDKIYASLNWGGAFIMFEKVRAPDARFQDITTTLYTDFKLQQGFKEEEIIHKSRSLKGVLEPFSTQGNIDLMKRAGFVDYMTIFKHLCFEGFLAIK